MEAPTEFFPHEGEHLDNDARQARIFVPLLAIFAVLSSLLIVWVLRSL